MPTYQDYHSRVNDIHDKLINEILKKISFKKFEEDRGHKVSQVLPGSNEEYSFEINGISGYIDTKSRKMYNPIFNDIALTVNRMASNPYNLNEFIPILYKSWEDYFGEIEAHNHSYNTIPIKQKEVTKSVESLQNTFDIICTDPTLMDLIYAINDKNYLLSARFLGVDNPQHLMTPGGNHELSNLFTKGDINVHYFDNDIAVLKPEYDHEMKARVLNQQRRWERVTLRGEQPEEAFVVGYDDTPVGLFAHVIDGTRLDVGQDVSRNYIHSVMGFDRNYKPHEEDTIVMNLGEKIRLQGDLGVEYMGDPSIEENKNMCYIPLDNHLISLKNGAIPDNESLEQEPVRVNVPEETVMNIAHDEHENVITKITPGHYKFYLLPRGLQLEENRPNWPEE